METTNQGGTNHMELKNIKLDLIDRNPLQPRTSERDIAKLAAGIKQDGMLMPPIVLAESDRYVMLAGHRRLEAARVLEWTEMTVLVSESRDAAKQIEAIMAENTQRDDLSAVELARGMQTMMDSGIKPAQITKTTGIKPAEVKLAHSVSQASDSVAEDVRAHQATFEEAIGLMEFESDKETYNVLLDNVGGGSFAHTLERRRQDRDRLAKREAAIAKLTRAGVKIHHDHYRSWNGWVTVKETKMTAAAHKTCPGHIAVVDYHGTVACFCTQPAEHGIKVRAESSPPKDKAVEKAKRENRAAHRAATTVRLRFLSGILLTKRDKVEVGLAAWACNYAWKHGLGASGDYSALARLRTELMGDTEPTTPLNGVITLAIAEMEKRLENHNKFDGMVHALSDGSGGKDPCSEVIGYFVALTALLYELSEAEQSFIDTCSEKLNAAPKTIDPGTPLTAEECAAIAGEEPQADAPAPNVECFAPITCDSQEDNLCIAPFTCSSHVARTEMEHTAEGFAVVDPTPAEVAS